MTDTKSRDTLYELEDGTVVTGTRLVFSSLYKEFQYSGKILKFYLYQANEKAFHYKVFSTRELTQEDRKIKPLLVML